MATYKVLQDIEAEDKLLGPLSLRQFVYAGIVFVSAFIAFRFFFIAPWLVLIFLPHMIFFGILAAPFGHDQSSEVWLLAKIRFALKPRKRIWDQSGVKELVTITAPKRIEKQLTKNFTQNEVKSRLRALATTIDSRGWAVKNVNVNLYNQPAYAIQGATDRLIDMGQVAHEVPDYDSSPDSDMFDETNNPTAQHFNQLMASSAQTHRQQVMDKMRQANTPTQTPQHSGPQPDYWFLNEPRQQPKVDPGYATFDKNATVQPGQPEPPQTASPAPQAPAVSAEEEQALLEQLHQKQNRPDPMNSHLKTIQPLSVQQEQAKQKAKEEAEKRQQQAESQTQTTSSTPVDPVILELSRNNDLNLETVSRQAKKSREQPPDDEVVVSLH